MIIIHIANQGGSPVCACERRPALMEYVAVTMATYTDMISDVH